MKSIRIIWQCEYCKDVVVSYSNLSHNKNYCECGLSAMDLEQSYQLEQGKVSVISTKIFKDNKWELWK